MKTRVLLGQPSWELHSDRVSLALARRGGQLGPVEFDLGRGRVVAPLHVAPWHDESSARDLPPILRVLRGDFFCLPFGGNETRWRGEAHPVHGETANVDWGATTVSTQGAWTSLRAHLDTKIRPGHVEKWIGLKAGQTAIYSRHTISGMSGPMNVGHHAMLDFSRSEGLVAVAPFVRGQVFPGEFESPVRGGYSSLKPGALFRSLERVPLSRGGFADLTRYPAREGFEDLVMVSAKKGAPLGWSAVTFPGERFVWFSLRDPAVLASTVLWHSNGGRHYAPWNGRHRKVLGIEDVTSYFHYGLAESAAPNPVSKAGIPTILRLNPERPTVVSAIMGVALAPDGFGRVRSICQSEKGIRIEADNGKRVHASVDLDFLQGNESVAA